MCVICVYSTSYMYMHVVCIDSMYMFYEYVLVYFIYYFNENVIC